MKTYDLVVIGGGAGGLVVAAGAAGFGADVALVEKEKLGGDCLWTGCVPSKSLIRSAKIAHTVRCEGEGRFAFEAARQRWEEAIASAYEHDRPERFEALGVAVYHGGASFESSRVIRIDGQQRIRGRRFVIATGSKPSIPPVPGLQENGFLTNETVFERVQAPGSLLVMGGGPVGLEMAQAFARFGTDVTVVEAGSDLVPQEDPDIAGCIHAALQAEGLSFHMNAKAVDVRSEKRKKIVTLASAGGGRWTVEVDEILVATGRSPNTDLLDLQKAGVEVSHGRITVNARLQTSVSHIYAIGDVNGYMPFTHAAAYEGKIAVSNALFGLRRKARYDGIPWVIYTDPEIFHLGRTESQARRIDPDVRVYTQPLRDVDRFIADRQLEGMIKIVTDRKGRILGAHAAGEGAGEWMQEVVFAKRYGYKIGALSHAIHPYPTRAVGLQQTADLYWRDKLFSGWVPSLLKAYVRWFRFRR